MTDSPRQPEHYAYESDYEQHRAWASMSEDEKLESLWFGQLSFVRRSDENTRKLEEKSDKHDFRLRELNGNVQKTIRELADHKQYHREELAGISFIKIWGARGTALIMVAVAVLGGMYYITQIVNNLTR